MTRAKQNPIVIACGTNVFFDTLKKKIAWTIPRPRYTTNSTEAAGTSTVNCKHQHLTNRDFRKSPNGI
jgi:hypothetical protein